MKNNIIAVTGMTGVGKDFLIERANTTPTIKTSNLGTIIGTILNADRDNMMATVSPERIRQAQLKAYKEVTRTQPHIVTCHAIRLLDGVYNYDLVMERIFNPRLYVFVTAPPKVIVERVRLRNRAGLRKSEELPVEEVAKIQQIKLEKLEALTQILGCELTILTNTSTQLSYNTKKLQGLFQGLIV